MLHDYKRGAKGMSNNYLDGLRRLFFGSLACLSFEKSSPTRQIYDYT